MIKWIKNYFNLQAKVRELEKELEEKNSQYEILLKDNAKLWHENISQFAYYIENLKVYSCKTSHTLQAKVRELENKLELESRRKQEQ